MGLLARHFLLGPSPIGSERFREQLLALRSSTEQVVENAGHLEDRSQIDRLRGEMEAYWSVLDPMFPWTPQAKSQRSWMFLQNELLLRREAALRIIGQVHSWAQASLRAQRRDIDSRQTAMANFIHGMLAATLLLGTLIAWPRRPRRSYGDCRDSWFRRMSTSVSRFRANCTTRSGRR